VMKTSAEFARLKAELTDDVREEVLAAQAALRAAAATPAR